MEGVWCGTVTCGGIGTGGDGNDEFLVKGLVRGSLFVRCLVWGGNFSWQKHEWCGSWSAKTQKGGFMGLNALVGKRYGISSQSSTQIISVRCRMTESVRSKKNKDNKPLHCWVCGGRLE